MRKNSIFTLLLLGCSLFFLNTTLHAQREKWDISFGVPATAVSIDPATIHEPILSDTQKCYVTDNKFGFDVLSGDSNWVLETFLEDIKPGMTVMDVGSGYGALTRKALDQGAVVISNDLSEKQLYFNLKHVPSEQKENLFFNTKDIRSLNFKPHSLDSVIFHRVLHFFKGKDIEAVLNKAYQWLKPGGKIYIVMISKDHVAYRDKINYDTSKKWPGENLVIVKEHLPAQAYALPKKLHAMSIETLESAIERAGFEVEEADYVSLKKMGIEANRDGKEAVGVIGVKRV